jgi:hypothetical protein
MDVLAKHLINCEGSVPKTDLALWFQVKKVIEGGEGLEASVDTALPNRDT